MTYSPQQIQEALRRSGVNRGATPVDISNAQKYGLGIFAANRRRMAAPPSAPTSPTNQMPEDITKSFIDQVRDLLAPSTPRPDVKPFDQSGFYNEGDTRSLAEQEYSPYYKALSQYTGAQNAEQDRNRTEEVNASGGLQSSAYLKEQELRRQALQRSAQEQADQERAAKEGFVQNRRNDAFQRYLQSIGSLS